MDCPTESGVLLLDQRLGPSTRSGVYFEYVHPGGVRAQVEGLVDVRILG